MDPVDQLLSAKELLVMPLALEEVVVATVEAVGEVVGENMVVAPRQSQVVVDMEEKVAEEVVAHMPQVNQLRQEGEAVEEDMEAVPQGALLVDLDMGAAALLSQEELLEVGMLLLMEVVVITFLTLLLHHTQRRQKAVQH